MVIVHCIFKPTGGTVWSVVSGVYVKLLLFISLHEMIFHAWKIRRKTEQIWSH